MNQEKCEAERIGLKVGNAIFLLAGTKELVCKECKLDCPYNLRDYSKKEYQSFAHKE